MKKKLFVVLVCLVLLVFINLPYTVAEEATIQDVIDAAGITIENEDVKLDGVDVDLNDEIGDGKLVTIVPKVKGGK